MYDKWPNKIFPTVNFVFPTVLTLVWRWGGGGLVEGQWKGAACSNGEHEGCNTGRRAEKPICLRVCVGGWVNHNNTIFQRKAYMGLWANCLTEGTLCLASYQCPPCR